MPHHVHIKNPFRFTLPLFLLALCAHQAPARATTTPATVDFSRYQADGKIAVSTPDPNTLTVNWAAKDGRQNRAHFNLTPAAPLLRSLEIAPRPAGTFQTAAQNVDVKYRVTIGNRPEKTAWPYIFFDTVGANKPPPISHISTLDMTTVRVVNESPHRLKLVFSPLQIGPYKGELTCLIYDQSPFMHFQATMLVDEPRKAFIYDTLFYADYTTIAYRDPNGAFQTNPAPGEPAAIAAKHRAILGTLRDTHGTLAIMGAPHTTCVYPTDFSDNYGYLHASKNCIGTKMSYHADRRFAPWIDAPNGSTQRMDIFLLFSDRPPQDMLAQDLLPYTNNDTYKPIPGHYTMAEHFHAEFTDNHRRGNDTITPFKKTMQNLGVQIVQMMEFHGPGHPMNDQDNRLSELHDMYELLRQHSDDTFLFIPGEEYNRFFGGHWSYMFPRPVYFTGWTKQDDRPYTLTNVRTGTTTLPRVYQIGDAEHMTRLLREQNGIAWSSHPRIKASRTTPDSLVNTAFYQDDTYLAGDWKAMPLDLSQDRLGTRSLQLMDETAQWGYRKSMLGEVDTFRLDPTHEIYAHMNINYLRLPALPPATDWTTVVNCLRTGDFFTTTGEVLIHSWHATPAGVTARVEWYFPPAFAEITWGAPDGIHRLKKPLPNETEFDTQTITLPADLTAANWVRLEIWDIARNGAFTQPHWFRPPARPPIIAGAVTGFTLIDADTATPVPNYDPIPDNATLDRATLPPNLALRANTTPLLVDSVTLTLDNATVTRTRWPYTFADCKIGRGGRDSPAYDYGATKLSPGRHTITATPQQKNATGQSRTLNFTVR